MNEQYNEFENGKDNPVSEAKADDIQQIAEAAEGVVKQGNSVGKEILSWVLTIAIAVVAAMCIRNFIFEPVRVDGHSMCDTLQDREVMFTTRFDYVFGKPQFGDVVICKYPGRGNTKFVKRVMGVPGDTIEIRDFQLYRNGEAVDQSFLTPSRNCNSLRSMMFGPVTLEDDQYLVMGDNRDNSNDSRYIGPVSENMILGHVRCVFFPFKNARVIH